MGSLTGNFFTDACAQSFSPRVTGRFSNTTNVRLSDEELFVPQTANSHALEHISFSDEVSI